MAGYTNKIAVIDLEKRKVEIMPVEEDLKSYYIGGRGFITKFLYDQLSPQIDALSPDNILVIAVGPLTGTISPSSGRWHFGTKSPVTGLINSGSAGGFWGAELKWAGFDCLVIKGRADTPTYLFIEDDKIDFLSAKELWGKDTSQTEKLIKQYHNNDPRISIACIGPAGENLVPIANLLSERYHAVGRNGIGAVMGSKNLKAIAVKGNKGIEVAHPRMLEAETKKFFELLKTWKPYPTYLKYGTSGFAKIYKDAGMLSTCNFTKGPFPGIENLTDEERYSKFFVDTRLRACFGCPMPCVQQFVVTEGKYAGTWGDSPQIAVSVGWGMRVGSSDFGGGLKAHVIANRLGICDISTAAVIAFAIECYQAGIIGKEDTEGLELNWGDMDVIFELMKKIAYAEGIGKVLGTGSREAAKVFGKGADYYAMHSKGSELSSIDGRVAQNWGLSYAVSSRGAHHMRAYPPLYSIGVPDDLLIEAAGTSAVGEMLNTDGQGRFVAFLENMRAEADTLLMCLVMTRFHLGFPRYHTGLLEAVTGRKADEKELLKIGERIVNLERLFNLREGLTPDQDTLPKRMLNDPFPSGPAKGSVVNLKTMLEEYYKFRDWDMKTGYPSEKKLSELDLEK